MYKRITLTLAGMLLYPSVVLAQNTEICKGATGQDTCAGTGLPAYFKDIANALIFVAGSIAVIVIIIGGLNYITSTGDAARIAKAKNTIIYAVVGVVVAILAYAIVNFVIGRL